MSYFENCEWTKKEYREYLRRRTNEELRFIKEYVNRTPCDGLICEDGVITPRDLYIVQELEKRMNPIKQLNLFKQ